MTKAIIVEDEAASVNIIRRLTLQFDAEIEIVATASNVRDAVLELSRHDPDILFLDIELGDGLVFEILEQLPHLKARVIFITAYGHYALKALKAHAFEYLLKPLVPEELYVVLHKVLEDIRDKQLGPDTKSLLSYLKEDAVKKIAVPSKNGLHYYLINDIIYVEGEGSYTKLYLANAKEVIITRRIKDFEKCLAGKGFLRVHKSYLVNVSHISELHKDDGGYLLMANGRQVPLRTRHREEIIAQIRESSYVI
jgi:two-component system LytT family response regulator